MALSKKYYEMIAEVLSEADSVADVAFALSEAFEEDNPRFDSEKFLSVAGVEPEDFSFLAVGSSAGIYVPQRFVEEFEDRLQGVSREDVETVLAGPDEEFYWEAWDNIDRDATVEIDGVEYNIFHQEDLWLIRVDAPDAIWDRLAQ